MVRPCALHPAAAVLDAAPEVAAAYHNTHLDAQLDAALNHIADAADHIKIQATRGLSSQGFAADLQQHPLIFRFFHVLSPLHRFASLRSSLFYNKNRVLERGNFTFSENVFRFCETLKFDLIILVDCYIISLLYFCNYW